METRGLPSDGHKLTLSKAMQPIQPTDSATPSLVAPSSDRLQPSQQARLLQLRNAGFRGQTIPIRRISPILGSSGVLSPEPSHRVVSNENTPHNLEKRQLFGEDLPLSPVSILQELHNSAQRRRRSRPSIGAIFQDGTATPAADGNSDQSWYTETSNKNSKTTPTVSRNSSIPMNKLRDVSFNGKTPPISSSPLPKQSRSGNGNRVHRRTTSAEAAKYIEHLESQLVAVNTKLDSLMSPTSHKARAAKLRALTSEARSLRLQVSDWEQKFDERVKDKRDELAEVEMSLAARLQALEDEVEAKDNRVKGLEWELENLRTRVKDAEGLEAVNTDLERRIDVLTNLLVQSPTKLDLCSANTSPSKPEPYKRMTRPRSMMPRVPPSPGSMRLSLSIGSDAQFRRSRQSVASTSSASPSPDTTSGPSFKGGQLQTSEGKKESKDSSDQSSGNSSLFQSPPSSSSRPTSLYSNGSFGAYSWGLPLPPEAEPNGKANYKQRRMRRFPSGAASLKPLILPSTAGTPSLSASAPVKDTFPGTTQRDFSDASLDPTIAFLSKYELHSPVTTPTQPGRRRSASSAQTEALSALEGRSISSEEKDGHSMLSPCSSSDELLETVQEESFDGKSPRPERPRSLGEELEEVGLLFRNSFDDGLNPHANEDKDQSLVITADQPESDASQSHTLVQQQQSPKSTEPRMKPKTKVAPTRCASCTPKLVASVAVATPQGHGLLSRLKCLVSRTKQGPSALARRLIYNAWAVGLARLGGLGWWLLGLVYATRRQKNKRAADAETTVDETPTRGMDWRHFPPSITWSSEVQGQRNRHYDRRDDQIARTTTIASATALYRTPSTPHHEKPKDSSMSRHQLHLVPCPDCKEPWTRRSLRLWFRFSLALVLAVGLAIKDGPGTLLNECHASDERLYERWQITPQKVRSATSDGTQACQSAPSCFKASNERQCRCVNDAKSRSFTRAA